MDDDLPTPTAAEHRERSERAPAQARSRYRDHLTEVLGGRGVEEAAAVADVVLDALTEWRYIDTGERCTCSCHPRLPDRDLHDYGFDCVCTRTREQRSTYSSVLSTRFTTSGIETISGVRPLSPNSETGCQHSRV